MYAKAIISINPFLLLTRCLHSFVVGSLQRIAVLTVFYGHIGLSHDKTKYLDSKSPGIPVLVNQTSLQMATYSMTRGQYVHVYSCG